MKTKTITIAGITYQVVEWDVKHRWPKDISRPEESLYLAHRNTVITGNIACKHLYIQGDHICYGYMEVSGSMIIQGNQRVTRYQRTGEQTVCGYQFIGEDQRVKGNQYIEDGQWVKGDQIIEGNQHIGDRQRQIVDGIQTIEGRSVH